MRFFFFSGAKVKSRMFIRLSLKAHVGNQPAAFIVTSALRGQQQQQQ